MVEQIRTCTVDSLESLIQLLHGMDYGRGEGLAFYVIILQGSRNTKIAVNYSHGYVDAWLYFARINIAGLFKLLHAQLEILPTLNGDNALRKQ